MLPQRGPVLFSVPGVSGVLVPLGGGSIGPIEFRWPRALFCTGLLLFPSSSADPIADAASLRIRVQDEQSRDLVNDGRASTVSVGALGLAGMGLRPFPLQRPVLDGDKWNFTIFNDGAADLVAQLLLFFEEGLRK